MLASVIIDFVYAALTKVRSSQNLRVGRLAITVMAVVFIKSSKSLVSVLKLQANSHNISSSGGHESAEREEQAKVSTASGDEALP